MVKKVSQNKSKSELSTKQLSCAAVDPQQGALNTGSSSTPASVPG
jgi:hypothetical protein